MRNKKKKAIMDRSPIASAKGVFIIIASAKICFGSATGIASCGTAGASRHFIPSTSRATGRLKVACALWTGLSCPASWHDVEMAPSASVTLPTLMPFPRP